MIGEVVTAVLLSLNNGPIVGDDNEIYLSADTASNEGILCPGR